METITYFFSNALAMKVLLGVVLISATAGIVGTFSFLQKKTLVGDAISHSVFPGVCIGFMISGTKDPLYLMVGALFFGWFSVLLIDFLSKKTKMSEDSAIAFVSTFFFALGAVFLSVISKNSNGNQSGLKDFLFGKAATMTLDDIEVFVYISLLISVIVILYFRSFQLISFNRDFAISKGFKVKRIEFLLSTITVLTVSIGIQSVGIVLTSALLIAPASAARYWTNNLVKMLIIAALIGVVSGATGVLISCSQENMPTGPWIVFVLFTITLLTLLFSPKKGWFSIQKVQRINKRKINQENVLKVFYQLKEKGIQNVNYKVFLEKRQMESADLMRTIQQLQGNGLIHKKTNHFELTELGLIESARIVRLHRLWELYLTKRMNFKEDHIHGTAETIEHLITPEMEIELMKELDYPKEDPHNKNIPYL